MNCLTVGRTHMEYFCLPKSQERGFDTKLKGKSEFNEKYIKGTH
jgi:hypothetical protein